MQGLQLVAAADTLVAACKVCKRRQPTSIGETDAWLASIREHAGPGSAMLPYLYTAFSKGKVCKNDRYGISMIEIQTDHHKPPYPTQLPDDTTTQKSRGLTDHTTHCAWCCALDTCRIPANTPQRCFTTIHHIPAVHLQLHPA
jgi:hypothetical protein